LAASKSVTASKQANNPIAFITFFDQCVRFKSLITARPLLPKLLQEPDIIFVQQPDVIQPVHQRAQPIQSQSEGEAGEVFGIDRDGAQHVRVDHSRPAHLDPAGTFADATAPAAALEAGVIDLRARFYEREIGWAEARACFGA